MPTEARIQELRGSLQALEPRGLIWTQRPGSVRERLLSAFAALGATFEEAVFALLDEADPRTTNDLLREWERWLGLPDDCMPADAELTLDERRAQVTSMLRAVGGCTPAFYEALALDLGYVVTVTEYRQFRVGYHGMGDSILGDDWAYTWQINAAQTTVHYFHVGSSGMGDPLSTSGNQLLECFFERIKPAHTILLFGYT